MPLRGGVSALPLRGGVLALPPDFVAGATITARLMRAAVLDTARLVLRTRIAREAVTVPTLDVDGFTLMSWDELITEGAVARRRLTSGEVAAALAKAGAADAAPEVPLGKPGDLYVELFFGLLTLAAIGGNVLGFRCIAPTPDRPARWRRHAPAPDRPPPWHRPDRICTGSPNSRRPRRARAASIPAARP